MINTTQLYQKFNKAVRWNSVLFFFNKISKTALSFFLYYKLTAQDFSTWANVYSFIFIFTLWTDFGFSRALPQYCLIFAKNDKEKKRFISKVLIFKILISLFANTLFIIFTPKIAAFLHLQNYKKYFYLGCILFFAESIRSVFRLIFYSYFWQRSFNLIESFVISIHTITIIAIISFQVSSNAILSNIFIAQIIATATMVLVSIFMLSFLCKDKDYQGHKFINTQKSTKNFIKHCLAMWGLISINSLTERNFLFPFLTHTLGFYFANIFKVANDAALLFQRFVIKSIGTTGTSLFAHIETNQVKPTQVPVALDGDLKITQHQRHVGSQFKRQNLFGDVFSKLTKRIVCLVFPLFGILLFLLLQTKQKSLNFQYLFFLKNGNHYIFKVFLLLATLYLIQIIFMAYERILEVKRDYKELFISFLPYLGIIFFLLYCLYNKQCTINYSLISILLIIHVLRILSLAARVTYAKIKYNLKFPLKFTFCVVIISIIASIALNFFVNIFR
jgi:hypothetical protein